MKHLIGIMQGRLTQPKDRGIQFFPFDNWKNEFYIAQQLGLDEIEFIFDYENYENNPLWTEEGIQTIKKITEETNVQINAVCFDYFMRRPFYKADSKGREIIENENTQIIMRVLSGMKRLGINLLEIPLVDASSLQNEEEKDNFRKWLISIADRTDGFTRFGLETDLQPEVFKQYIESFNRPGIGANYDSGNSSGLGYDVYKEITTLRDYIFNIHIKDRVYHGTTVQLGSGNADFEQLFRALQEIQYKHNFILQAARGEEGEEEKHISFQMKFVNDYIMKYNV